MLSCAAGVDAAGTADSEDAADAVGAVDAEPEHAVTEAESMNARAHAASDDGIFPMPLKNERMIIKYLLFCH